MNAPRSTLLALWGALALAAPQAMAQTMGAAEYARHCAACHGADGKGSGPMTGYLTVRPPDLTGLSRANGGVFPVSAVYTAIESGGMPGVHGTRDMPVWGTRYRRLGALGADPDNFEAEAGLFAQTRLLALTEYLASIQEE